MSCRIFLVGIQYILACFQYYIFCNNTKVKDILIVKFLPCGIVSQKKSPSWLVYYVKETGSYIVTQRLHEFSCTFRVVQGKGLILLLLYFDTRARNAHCRLCNRRKTSRRKPPYPATGFRQCSECTLARMSDSCFSFNFIFFLFPLARYCRHYTNGFN